MISTDNKEALVSKTFDLVGQVFKPDGVAMGRLVEACFDGLEFKGKSVLDAGCGTGIAGLHFAANGAARVIGIDVSHDSVSKAKRQAIKDSLNNTDFMQANVSSLPFKDASFDIAISIGVLPYVDDARPSLKEMARVVAGGGTILILSLRKTKWDFLLECARRMASVVPLRHVLFCSRVLELLFRPFSFMILKRKEAKSGKTLQQTIIEAFFIPVKLKKVEPKELKKYLKIVNVDSDEMQPPTLSFCSPATVFIIKGKKAL